MLDNVGSDEQSMVTALEMELEATRLKQVDVEDMLWRAAEMGQSLLEENEVLEQDVEQLRGQAESYDYLENEVERLRELANGSRMNHRRRTSKFEEILNYNATLDDDLRSLRDDYRLLQAQKMQRVVECSSSESESDDDESQSEVQRHDRNGDLWEDELESFMNEEGALCRRHETDMENEFEQCQMLKATLDMMEAGCAHDSEKLLDFKTELWHYEQTCEQLNFSCIQLQERLAMEEQSAAQANKFAVKTEATLRHILDEERSQRSAAMMLRDERNVVAVGIDCVTPARMIGSNDMSACKSLASELVIVDSDMELDVLSAGESLALELSGTGFPADESLSTEASAVMPQALEALLPLDTEAKESSLKQTSLEAVQRLQKILDTREKKAPLDALPTIRDLMTVDGLAELMAGVVQERCVSLKLVVEQDAVGNPETATVPSLEELIGALARLDAGKRKGAANTSDTTGEQQQVLELLAEIGPLGQARDQLAEELRQAKEEIALLKFEQGLLEESHQEASQDEIALLKSGEGLQENHDMALGSDCLRLPAAARRFSGPERPNMPTIMASAPGRGSRCEPRLLDQIYATILCIRTKISSTGVQDSDTDESQG